MKKLAAVVAVLPFLAACQMTLPVVGQANDGSESFKGSATGYADGSGTLTITTSRGRSCSGSFVYVNRRQGSGTFTCNDGSSGPFEFVSTGTRGTGTGYLGNKGFTFTFG